MEASLPYLVMWNSYPHVVQNGNFSHNLNDKEWSRLHRPTVWRMKIHICYTKALVPETGFSSKDKYLHPTVNCGIKLLIPAWDTCF